MAGLPGQGLLVAHPLGDVGVRDDDLARGLDPCGLHPEPDGVRAQLAGVVVDEGPVCDARPAGQELADARTDDPPVLGRQVLGEHGQVVVADQSGTQPGPDDDLPLPGPPAVHRRDPAVAVQQHRGRGQRLQDGAQLLQLCRRPVLGAVAFVDVAQEGGEAVGVAEGPDLVPPALRLVEVVELADPSVEQRRPVLALDDRAERLGQALERVPADHLLGPAAEDPLSRGVHVGEAPPAVDPVDGVGDRGQGVDGRGVPTRNVSVHPVRFLFPCGTRQVPARGPHPSSVPPRRCPGAATHDRG